MLEFAARLLILFILRRYALECSGYMAPEYAMHGYLSVKSDVFSFGVLMLEIVSGRKNLDDRLGPEKADLMSYVSSERYVTYAYI